MPFVVIPSERSDEGYLLGTRGGQEGWNVRNDLQQRGLRWLNIGRWWLCGTAMFMVVPLVPEMIRNYRKWHAAIVSDPSAAGFWRTAFYLGMARFAVEIILIAAIFLILKPRPNMLGFRADRDDAPAKDNTRP